MNAKKKRRLAFAAALLVAGVAVAGVVVYGLGQNTMYFRSPSDVAAKMVGEGVAFRLGGLVENGSVQHGAVFGGHTVVSRKDFFDDGEILVHSVFPILPKAGSAGGFPR